MREIIENIVKTWWGVSDNSLRKSCITHVRSTIPWRGIVSTHNFKGINNQISSVLNTIPVVNSNNKIKKFV